MFYSNVSHTVQYSNGVICNTDSDKDEEKVETKGV